MISIVREDLIDKYYFAPINGPLTFSGEVDQLLTLISSSLSSGKKVYILKSSDKHFEKSIESKRLYFGDDFVFLNLAMKNLVLKIKPDESAQLSYDSLYKLFKTSLC